MKKIEDKDILNSSNMFEKTMKVSSNLKIQVNFVEIQKETKEEIVPETETELITETEVESQTEEEPDIETSLESETDASQDGILSEKEREQALQLSGEMENAIEANECIMTFKFRRSWPKLGHV